MKQTEQFQLSQWDSTDRIKMEDFNTDNAKIEAALNKKLEPVLLLDKTEKLTDQLYWNVQLPFTPGDWFALIIELNWPGGYIYLNASINDPGTSIQLSPKSAVVGCFPMKNVNNTVCFAPLAGINAGKGITNREYGNLTWLSIHSISGNLQNGTYRIRIFGF